VSLCSYGYLVGGSRTMTIPELEGRWLSYGLHCRFTRRAGKDFVGNTLTLHCQPIVGWMCGPTWLAFGQTMRD
jgi:hypothetical protein